MNARHPAWTWLSVTVVAASMQTLAQVPPLPPPFPGGDATMPDAPRPPDVPTMEPAPPASPVEFPRQPPESAPTPEPALPAPVTNAVTRDPFWPIGYVPLLSAPLSVTPQSLSVDIPAPPTAAVRSPAPVIEWPSLKVRGVTRGTGGRQIALIEGVGLVEAGHVVHVTNRGVTYTWRVVRIDGRTVEFERLSADAVAAGNAAK